MKIYFLPLPLSPSIVRFLSLKHIAQREKLIMQNYLAARYRRVHNRIKDVGISDLGGKFSKAVKEIRILSLLHRFPQSLSKVSFVGATIAAFPDNHYWRKSRPFRFWTVCLIVCLPVIYQYQATKPEKLEILRRNLEASAESDRTEEEGGNIPRG
ncbi:uncharacterized protein LOC117231755 [Bombus vosnesenskii]|uniref:Uncharacterized protein LOC117231755 n=1 Tax=Bombus vosnesenskii TaxID=207650 RepID=A0A6J3JZR4_9HYME|nr:uncharacterized protein LOC117231755 [Bombus vosnesenskii]